MGNEAKTGPRRDVRVDRIGFVGELMKQYIDGDHGLKAKVKGELEAGQSAEGDYFVGRLDAAVAAEISASGVYKLHKQGKLSEAELIEMISVKSTVAKEKIDPKTLKRLTRTYEGTPRLTITRKKGVEIKLVDAVRGLSSAIDLRPASAA